MSRSGYSDDCDWDMLNLWRGAVDRSIGGKRGQAFLREMGAALDAMPVKELIAHEIVTKEGDACAIGTVALARRMDVTDLDPEDPDSVAQRFGIARAMACEITYVNDELGDEDTPAERWTRMRKWVAKQLTAKQ